MKDNICTVRQCQICNPTKEECLKSLTNDIPELWKHKTADEIIKDIDNIIQFFLTEGRYLDEIM